MLSVLFAFNSRIRLRSCSALQSGSSSSIWCGKRWKSVVFVEEAFSEILVARSPSFIAGKLGSSISLSARTELKI